MTGGALPGAAACHFNVQGPGNRARVQKPKLVFWSLVAEAAPAWRRWDEEYVVHHALSNDTHRLSGLAGCALQSLVAAERMDAHELARACEHEESEVCATLMALAELGFVVQC